MQQGLNWKWVGIGVVIMLGLNILAGFLLALMLGSDLPAPTAGAELTLSMRQALLVAALGAVSFAIGGYIVAARSTGSTIIEPGISAAIAVALGLLIGGSFTLVNLLAGGIIPFLAGLFGGWLGERRQAGR